MHAQAVGVRQHAAEGFPLQLGEGLKPRQGGLTAMALFRQQPMLGNSKTSIAVISVSKPRFACNNTEAQQANRDIMNF